MTHLNSACARRSCGVMRGTMSSKGFHSTSTDLMIGGSVGRSVASSTCSSSSSSSSSNSRHRSSSSSSSTSRSCDWLQAAEQLQHMPAAKGHDRHFGSTLHTLSCQSFCLPTGHRPAAAAAAAAAAVAAAVAAGMMLKMPLPLHILGIHMFVKQLFCFAPS